MRLNEEELNKMIKTSLQKAFSKNLSSLGGNDSVTDNFVSMNNVTFKRKIIPGETLLIDSQLTSFRRGLAKGHATSTVNEEVACSADFVITVPAIFEKFMPPKNK